MISYTLKYAALLHKSLTGNTDSKVCEMTWIINRQCLACVFFMSKFPVEINWNDTTRAHFNTQKSYLSYRWINIQEKIKTMLLLTSQWKKKYWTLSFIMFPCFQEKVHHHTKKRQYIYKFLKHLLKESKISWYFWSCYHFFIIFWNTTVLERYSKSSLKRKLTFLSSL